MKKARIYVSKENLDKLPDETFEKLRSGNLDLCIGFDNEEAFKEVGERFKELSDFNKFPPEMKEALMKIHKEAEPFMFYDPINN